MPITQLCPNVNSVPQVVACTRNDQNGSKSVSGRPKVSPQLNRWSRARALRSGQKLDRSSLRTQPRDPNPPPRPPPLPVDPDDGVSFDGTDVRSIYMISDGTGWTAEHCVNAALGQFDYCLVDRGCPVSTHLFSAVSKCKPYIKMCFFFLLILIVPKYEFKFAFTLPINLKLCSM